MVEIENYTYADRKADIAKQRKAAGRNKLALAHVERLAIIYKPFPVVQRIGTGSAMPWAGRIVTAMFAPGNTDTGQRRHTSGRGGDDTFCSIYERIADQEIAAAVSLL